MIIAVNTRLLLADSPEGYGNFIYETFKRITKQHPEHEFIFIFDRKQDKKFVVESNVKEVVAGPPATHPLLWKLWYDVRIPAILKKYKADVFISCDGFCSLATKVPQCLVVHDLAFIHYPSFMRKSALLFYRRYTPRYLNKATVIATVSQFCKQDIIAKYKTEAAKINVVFNGVKEIFRPVSKEDKAETKSNYTDNKEYFVYAGAIDSSKNLLNLLKAFSVFKKRQQTNMKLVLAGRLARKYGSFKENLKSYKYRNDVVMTGYAEETEMVKIIGSAYGMIYPSLFEGFGVPVLEAMRCEVPVITTSGSAMQEIAKDGALYAVAGNYNDIAGKMMLLYKDENLRKELIRKGQQVAGQYSWDRTADLLWQSIIKTAGRLT